MPPYAAQIIGFLLGLLFGSFLNVCISRVPKGESIVSPGSHCPNCKHPIRWFDNLPLVSWLILRGRCRDCKAVIPWRYPAVELALGLWFMWVADQANLIYDMAQPTAQVLIKALGGRTVTSAFEYSSGFIVLSGIAILGFLLIGLIVMDWQTQRLPDAFTLTGIAIGMTLVCIQAVFLGPTDDQIVLNTHKQLRLSSPGSFAAHGNVFLTGPESLIFGRLAAVCGAALILLCIRWAYKAIRHREGLGLGDVKLLAMIAAFLGFWPAVLTLFLGTLLASLYAVTLLIRKNAGALTRLPLGTFLGIAGLVVALIGEQVIAWYRTLLM